MTKLDTTDLQKRLRQIAMMAKKFLEHNAASTAQCASNSEKEEAEHSHEQ